MLIEGFPRGFSFIHMSLLIICGTLSTRAVGHALRIPAIGGILLSCAVEPLDWKSHAYFEKGFVVDATAISTATAVRGRPSFTPPRYNLTLEWQCVFLVFKRSHQGFARAKKA